MLGWHSAVHGEGNVAFSSSNNSNNNNGMALPLARRHELATPLPSVAANPSTVSASSSSSSCTESWPSSVQWLRSPLSAFRKRPGCLVDAHPHPTRSLDQDCRSGSGDRCGREDQPLDLTVPKLKVRQHWSGGCIVQVNDKAEAAATATTRVADATCNYCCASNCPSVAAGQADSQLIVTLQTSNSAFRPSLNETCCIHKGCAGAEGLSSDRPFVPLTSWPFAPRYEQESASEEPFWAETLAETRRQVSHQQRPTQLFWDSAGSNGLLQRLQVQVRIPHQPPSAGHTPTDQLTAVVPDKIVQFLRTTRPRKPAAASPASAAGLPAAAIPQPLRPLEATPAPVDSHLAMDDDLRRLTQCLHHLQSSGYYYGNLSWKESIQLLQGTAVGTFLVRDSADPRYLYALSIQTERGPTSVRIHYTEGCFRLDADSLLAERLPKFRSVPDLIDFYVCQWKRCREHGQVWLDNSGQVHSDVVLHKALMKQCPSLQHLCRLSWNQLPSETKLQWSLSGSIPQPVQCYLREYPYQY